MRTLYLDLENGLSGDIFLSALAGLGLDLTPLEKMFQESGLIKTLETQYVSRQGFSGLCLNIEAASNQPLRHLEELLEAGRNLPVSDPVWGKSRKAFIRLAEAEALAHGIPLDEVHFHEVGAVDTLLDVVGAFWGLEQLNITQVHASALPWFEGKAQTCHGEISLPAPATLRLMQGKPIKNNKEIANWEILTPTGALILDCAVDNFDLPPVGTFLKSSLAYGNNPKGLGTRALLLEQTSSKQDIQKKEQALELALELAEELAEEREGELAGEIPGELKGELENVWVLESHLDHLSGEDIGPIFDALLKEGALDVIYFPGIMKKNRPGGCLRVICAYNDLEKIEQAYFHHTHSLGLRRRLEERKILPRKQTSLKCKQLAAQPLAGKAYSVAGQQFSKPEFEALAQLARKSGRSIAEIKAMIYGSSFEKIDDKSD